MCCLDFPFLGVQVVGPRADVLGRAERVAQEADGDDAARCVVGQSQGLMAQIGDGLLVGKLHMRAFGVQGNGLHVAQL